MSISTVLAKTAALRIQHIALGEMTTESAGEHLARKGGVSLVFDTQKK